MGLFQEALQAMFVLINEMEMAIKINTWIISGNRTHLMKLSSLRVRLHHREVQKKRKKKKKQIAGLRNAPDEHERVLRALHFMVGCVKRLLLIFFKPAAF